MDSSKILEHNDIITSFQVFENNSFSAVRWTRNGKHGVKAIPINGNYAVVEGCFEATIVANDTSESVKFIVPNKWIDE